MENGRVEREREIRALCKVNVMVYGPYDNGYVVLGLADGRIVGFESGFEMAFEIRVYDGGESVDRIVFDPTNMIIVSSS